MRRRNNEGNILMSILLLVLVTFLGLGLLNVSIFHTRIRGARNYKNSAVDRMEQELIYYLHHFREKVMNTDIRDLPHPETGFFNQTQFPVTAGICDNKVSITNSFSYVDFPCGGYTKFRVMDRIDVTSGNNNYGINSEVFIDMACGRIPLSFFPFFLNKEIDKPEAIYLEENRVFGSGGGNPVVSDIDVEMDTTGYLMECLGIGGDALTWALIRQKFGYELTDEPLPEGIHLLEEDGVLRCIFVQGDVDRLLFSTEGDIQKLVFIRGYTPREYHYKPGENYFLYRDELRSEEMLYAENILVNGNIWSLEQEGEAAFTSKSNLTLFATGEIVIRSSLKADDGEGSSAVRSTHLTLLSCFEKLFGQEGKKPGITVDTVDAADGGTVRVSIITDGKVINKNPKLKVEGSIFTKELENNGVLEIDYLDSNSACREFFRTLEFNYIYHFHVNVIEEEEV